MIDVNELRKGVTFTMDGDLYRVIDYQHHKPGRGKAIIRTKLRNLRTWATLDKNFISGAGYPPRAPDGAVHLQRRQLLLLYGHRDL
jgi:translation elongation factor P/translation initiation factor 5A